MLVQLKDNFCTLRRLFYPNFDFSIHPTTDVSIADYQWFVDYKLVVTKCIGFLMNGSVEVYVA